MSDLKNKRIITIATTGGTNNLAGRHPLQS